jgi:hypothetical protein
MGSPDRSTTEGALMTPVIHGRPIYCFNCQQKAETTR